MILAQHSNAKMQAIHYTSPRLRTDALQDAGSIVREFARITQALKTAKRQEAVALAMRLALVEEEKARVKEELANQASELAAAHALLAGLGVPIPSPD
jgi:hypothetical protein